MSNLRLVKFSAYFGRRGELEGLFVLDDEDWQTLQNLIDSEDSVYFGEVLGKHSEVECVINNDNIQVLSENQEFCREFARLNLNTGYNPLNFLDEDEDDENG